MAEKDVTDHNAQIQQSASDVLRIKAMAQAAEALLVYGDSETTLAQIDDSVGRVLELIVSEADRVGQLLTNLPELHASAEGAA